MNWGHIVCAVRSLKSTTYENNILTNRVKLENLSIYCHCRKMTFWCQSHRERASCLKVSANNNICSNNSVYSQ